MFEKGTLIVLAAHIALFVKLTIMPEVRRVREVVGKKRVYLKITPQQIAPFYEHTKNHSVCNEFFYRQLLIKWSYRLCLLLTIASILIIGVASLSSKSQVSSQPASMHISRPSINKIEDLDLSTVKASTIISIRADRSYSMVDVSSGSEVLLVNPDGNVLKISSRNNMLYASLFFGILGGILCLVLAGPLKKIE